MMTQGFKDLFQWADGLSAVMAERNRGDLVKQIDEAKEALAANTFTLAVLGKAKRGKSTLINALLGRKDDALAPIDKLPATSAITRFRYGTTESATVLFRDGHRETVTYSRIKEFVTEELNPGNKKEVAMIEVVGPFPNLPQQVEIVDTPGAGSIHEHHDALLHAFIPQADAVVFLVTARMPLDQEELHLLREVKKQDIDKIFFVVNKVDEAEADEIESAVAHNRQLLAQCGITPEGFHKISAKYAYLGKPESNVPELRADLDRFLTQHKGAIIRQRFLSKVCGIVEPELRAIEVIYASGNKTGAELDADIASLQHQKMAIGGKREFQEKEFTRKWAEAVDTLAAKLDIAEQDTAAAVTEKLNDTGAFGVGRLVKELPTFLNQAVTDALSPVTERFELATRAACEELNADYPALSIDETGRIAFKPQKDMTAIKGLVTGGVAAAGGIGVASAGAAAAATIAATNAAAIAGVTSAAATIAAAGGTTAAAAGGTTIATAAATLVNAASTWLFGAPLLASGAAAATTTAAVTTTVAAPTLLTTPLWVALAGPVGWTLAGVGLLAVPFSWRLAKNKQKDKLEEAAQRQVKEIFKGIRGERVSGLRKMGGSILESFRNNLDYKIQQLEDALLNAKANRPSEAELARLKRQSATLSQLIQQSAERF